MTNITERYNQEIESTIPYDVSELLHTDLSDDLKERLINLGNPTVDKFIALFPIQDKIKFSVIKDALNGMKDILPKNLFEETKDEVTEICNDYKWLNSKNYKLILKIEEWIKDAKHYIAIDLILFLLVTGVRHTQRNSIQPYVQKAIWCNLNTSY